MKPILNLLAVFLLTKLSVTVYAQKNKTENDYILMKAYEVLNEEKDESKALGLVNKQLRETPDNIEALYDLTSQHGPELFFEFSR